MAILRPARLRTYHFVILSIFLTFFIYSLYSFAIPATSSIQSSATRIAQAPQRKNGNIQSNQNTRGSNLDSIANSTLGFGQIYVLNMPARTDKKDSLGLAAALTNITVNWREGVDGSAMHPLAVPPAHEEHSKPIYEHAGKEFTKDAEVGCWRGHMNILREVINSGVGSALILEDDADWDVYLRSQLADLAVGVQETVQLLPDNLKTCQNQADDSPYGHCWDILYIGHCGGWPPGFEYHKYHAVVKNDPTVQPVWDIGRVDLVNDLMPGTKCAAHAGRKLKDDVVCDDPTLKPNERIVQYKGSPICTTGYAVSQKGARKIMARLGAVSLVDVDSNLDTELTELCRGSKDENNRELTQCFSISPPLIMSHRARGLKNADSDINGGSKEMREWGLTKGGMYPTRLNIENLLAGKPPDTQYIEDKGAWRYRRKEEYSIF